VRRVRIALDRSGREVDAIHSSRHEVVAGASWRRKETGAELRLVRAEGEEIDPRK